MLSDRKPETISIVIQDLHHRITGVSSTAQNVHQVQKKRYSTLMISYRADVEGRVSLWKALRVCRVPTADGRPRIWHARRNYEMFWGILFKKLLRCPLILVLTAAAKREASIFPRLLTSQMDAVIATSADAAKFKKHVDAIIPHGVDCQRLCPPASKAALMAALGHPGFLGIGIFGRIRPEKGTDLFVRSMIELLPKYPQYKAFIVGLVTAQFTAFAEDLQSQIRQAGLEDRFIWTGEVKYWKVPEVFQAMSLVAATPRYEGFGVVPLEAMATGSPVVATKTGEYARMIVSGENGWLVDVEDQAAITARLADCMSDPARLESMGRNGRQFVLDHFSVEREVDAIDQVYQSLWAAEDRKRSTKT